MNSLIRRRDLAMKSVEEQGYITNGLIFFLDGLNRGGTAGHWIDRIGGKDFVLTNVTENADSVYFSGSSGSQGIYDGAVSSDWANETIETAYTTSLGGSFSIFYPPYDENGFGIGFVRGQTTFLSYRIASDANYKRYSVNQSSRRFSMNGDRCLTNKGTYTSQGNTTTFASNTTGKTFLGSRHNTNYYFKGTIYCVRIYNRKLTLAEQQNNLAVDLARYGTHTNWE